MEQKVQECNSIDDKVNPDEIMPLALRKTPRQHAGVNMYMKVTTPDAVKPSIRTKDSSTTKKRFSSGNNTQSTVSNSSKKRRLCDEQVHDKFCWLCHKESKNLGVTCQVCPRTYHTKCLGSDGTSPDTWVCPECEDTVLNENVDTRSKAMKMVTVEQLCNLLKYAVNRMKHQADEAFLKPVPHDLFPEYAECVNNPMDLNTLEKNIRKKMYGCTQSFLADAKWILHNCVVFNGYQHRLTSSVKLLLKVCKQEMDEIEACPDCYLHAYTKRDNWFCEPCRTPHILVWAKLKGFPFWPAKAMRVANGNVDVRFFGAHDRAWIPLNQCYLLSVDSPMHSKNKRKGSFEQSMEELEVHVKKLKEKFSTFCYAPSRMRLDPVNFDSHVSVFFPHMSASLNNTVTVTKKTSKNVSTGEKNADVQQNSSVSNEITKPDHKSEESGELPKAISTATETNDEKIKELPSVEVRLSKLESKKTSKPRIESCKKLESTIERIKENAVDKSDDENETTDIAKGETDCVQNQNSENLPLVDKVSDDETCTVPENEGTSENIQVEKGLSQSCEVTSTTRASPDMLISGDLNTNVNANVTDSIAKNLNNNDEISLATQDEPVVCHISSVTSGSINKDLSEGPETVMHNDGENVLEPKLIIPNDSPIACCDKKTSKDSENPDERTDDLITQNSLESFDVNTLMSGSKSDVISKNEEQVEMNQVATKLCNPEQMETYDDLDSDDGTNLVIDLNPESILGCAVSDSVPKDVSTTEVQSDKQVVAKKVSNKVKEVNKDGANDLEGPKLSSVVNQGIESDPSLNTPITVINISSSPPQMVPKPLPVLQPRPSTNMVQTTSMVSQPSSPGPGCDMNKYSRKLMDFMRGTVEEMVRDMAKSGNLEASLKLMQLEMEKLQWRHQQELSEIKHNTDLILLEMRASMESEKQKAIAEIRRQCEIEKEKSVSSIEEAKKKQWCSNCGKEALFYCCWNTSYCDYPCQQAHWPQHVVTCSQSHAGQDGELQSHISADMTIHGTLSSVPQVAKSVNIGSPLMKTVTQTQHVIASSYKSKLDFRPNQNVRGDASNANQSYQKERANDKQGQIRIQLPTMSQVSTLNPQYSTTLCPSVQYIPSNAVQVIPQTSSIANSAALQVQYVASLPPVTNSLTVPVSRSTFASIPTSSTAHGTPSVSNASMSTAKLIQPHQGRSLQISNSVYPIIIQPSSLGLPANSPSASATGRMFSRVPYIPGKPSYHMTQQ